MTRNKEQEDLIATICHKCGYYEENLIEIATDYVKYDDYHLDNGEAYKDVTSEEWEEFWKYFTQKTGIECPEGWNGAPFCDAPFSCSC